MNNKGQDALEWLFVIGGAVLIAAVFIALFAGQKQPDFVNAAENFCEAWAEERSFTYLDGFYKYYITSTPVLWCEYSADADVFDGGISQGDNKFKDFSISEKDLLEWADKSESKDCCEVCE